MSTTVSNNPVSLPLTASTQSDPASPIVGKSAVTDDPALLQALTQSMGKPQTTSDSAGLRDSNGAPAIASPLSNLSADDLIDMLRDLQKKSQDQQIKTATKNLEKAGKDAKANNEAQMQKIQEWIKKCEEAAKASLFKKIFSWIGKIAAVIASVVAVVASVVATPFTGGAATALVAISVIGLTAACVSLADQISQAAGGPEISLSNGLTKLMGGLLELCGVPKEKAEQIGKVMTMIVPIALLVEPQMLGTVVAGIAQLAGASDSTVARIQMIVGMVAALTVGVGMAVAGMRAGKLVGDVANMAAKMTGAIAQAAGQIIQGATTIGSGAADIAAGVLDSKGEQVLADKKELEAFMKKLNAMMEDQREEIRKLIQELEDGVTAVTQMIDSMADNMAQITQNVGRRATA